MIYIVSSRTVWATQGDPVSENKIKGTHVNLYAILVCLPVTETKHHSQADLEKAGDSSSRLRS